jgi:AhpD family alkylhydroperoxidase
MQAAVDALAAAKNAQSPASSLGLGIANSQRAMMRVPDIQAAWRAYGTTTREYAEVSREIKLHVSFAVSMANGCRYCVLHQVLGLRRLNVDPAKLMSMKKDDSALSQRELTAVNFARKLTRQPASISDDDYEKLKAEFKEQGALELLLQTCNFAFMNRFTDTLHLPSEDEAIKVYKEVYGTEWK